MEIDLNRI